MGAEVVIYLVAAQSDSGRPTTHSPGLIHAVAPVLSNHDYAVCSSQISIESVRVMCPSVGQVFMELIEVHATRTALSGRHSEGEALSTDPVGESS